MRTTAVYRTLFDVSRGYQRSLLSVMHLLFRFIRCSRLIVALSLTLASLGPLSAEPPRVVTVSPEPGILTQLSSITVTFSQPVQGVLAADFLLNGVPVTGVTGTDATYTFTFLQPAFGPVNISWGTLHQIKDLTASAERFVPSTSGSTWAYELIDPSGPEIVQSLPTPGAALRSFSAVDITFQRPVFGLEARDLQVNGAGATNVTGLGAGPYRFFYPYAKSGSITLQWAPNHGIVSDDPLGVPFEGSSWTYTVDPDQPPPEIIINEIMAENQTGIMDEEKDPEDWIELYNRGSTAVNLDGWTLSVSREEEGQWIFPRVEILAGQFLVVWASGKDRREVTGSRWLHTSFKLNPTGDTLRLFGPELPRVAVDELEYPKQAPNYSYARQREGGESVGRFFLSGTPGLPNGVSAITAKVDEVHFSVERGFFNSPFTLSLATQTPGAEIRFTTNGSPPNATNGAVYISPIRIDATRIIRAVALAPNSLPSQVRTHTYLMNLSTSRRLLPVLSLVTETSNLYGRKGIMEFSPRNTDKHGAAWERPVSVELIRPDDNGGFQIDAGLRVAGGDYIRGLYNYKSTTPPEGKYSFRLYFRGDYGPGRLTYPFFPGTTVDSFNTLHLRAGMNDPLNPFIRDEFIRTLSTTVGIPACHGTFVHLFLNGVYKGYYNPCERVDEDFLQAYHQGGDLWDVMGPNSAAIRGTTAAWNQLRTAVRKDLTVRTNYLDVADRMDLANFIDYVLPLIWADNDDWPHNNTRAARERIPGSKFRFYPWDAEFAFTSHGVTYDTIANTLSTLNPPWGTTDYQAIFNSLKKSYEFRLLFSDRVHRAFFNTGPLTDAKIRGVYDPMRAKMVPIISGFDNVVGSWIGSRRKFLIPIFQKAGLLASSNAPMFEPFGGRVPVGYPLTLTSVRGKIWFTTDGSDPRIAFEGIPNPTAALNSSAFLITNNVHLLARSLDGTNWSAVSEATFEVAQLNSPLRISEIMYRPPGGEEYEFVELHNTGTIPMNLGGYSFNGIQFRFPTPYPLLAADARLVVASDFRTNDFHSRYPSVRVGGWFGGSLANGGETIELIDPAGRVVTSVSYENREPWLQSANGGGSSLEYITASRDPNSPASWQASPAGGSPGQRPIPATAVSFIGLNELFPGTARDWIELVNRGPKQVDVSGWSISDDSNPRQFVFPPDTQMAPGAFLRLECDGTPNGGALHTPFQLKRSGEAIALYDRQTNLIEVVDYGPVPDGFSYGKLAKESGLEWHLTQPTSLAANVASELDSPKDVRINEFVANSGTDDDWIEFFNPGNLPISLEGCYVLTSNALARIAFPVFIGPAGFVVLKADNQPGADHLMLKLGASGGLIQLVDPFSQEIDHEIYPAQTKDVPLGRLPDGTGEFQRLPFSATPGARNYLAALGQALRLSEFMAVPSNGPSWVEVENVSANSILLDDHQLNCLRPGAPDVEWVFPRKTQLPAGQRLIIYCGDLPIGFKPISGAQYFPVPLPTEGAALTLTDPLNRVLDRVEYGHQLPDKTVGRSDNQWTLLSDPTPGLANSAPASLDPGLNLRLNEWLASSTNHGDFIELFNSSALPVDLNGWNLTDDPTVSGSTNHAFGPLHFVPGHGFLKFLSDGHPTLGPDHLPFQLDRFGETVRLLNAIHQIVDTVDFIIQSQNVSEGRYPDGAGFILRFPGSVTVAAANRRLPMDLDGDGQDDTWEILNGLDPNDVRDAFADADGDGVSNHDEYISVTNPNDIESVLRLTWDTSRPGQLLLRFIAQPNRAYRLEYASSLSDSTWTERLAVPSGEAQHEIEFSDPTPQPAVSARLYRVRLVTDGH
ncbi:MAG: hypothetical protein EXS36_08180 [Pedosphaera sp.]|nr:hypothetical protein [Pedosphaera sp.]